MFNNGTFIESGEDTAGKGEGWARSEGFPRIQWAFNCHCSYSLLAMVNIPLPFMSSVNMPLVLMKQLPSQLGIEFKCSSIVNP